MCMGIIKKFGTLHNLKKKQPFLLDRNPASDYFNITEFPETMGGGKNGFLIEMMFHLQVNFHLLSQIYKEIRMSLYP